MNLTPVLERLGYAIMKAGPIAKLALPHSQYTPAECPKSLRVLEVPLTVAPKLW